MPLTPVQQEIFDDTNRFRCVAAGRRGGKTFLALYEIARVARFPKRNIFYIAPSYRMAKQIVWDELKEKLVRLRWVKKVNESDLSILLINGSKISLRSSDNADSMRGVSLDLAILDEAAFMDSKTWPEVVRTTLSDRNGSALIISTPKGYDWFYDTWQAAHTTDDWAAYQYTTAAGGLVSESEIEQAKKDLDIRIYRQEYEATFESAANNIYHAFHMRENVKPYTAPTPDTILVGQDFNLDPGSAVMFARTENGLHIIDEVMLPNSNTDMMAQAIREKYPTQRIIVYPDPAGNQRRTSANKTDHTILKEHGFIVQTRAAHPAIKDRINAVNRLLCDASGERRLYEDTK